MSSEFKGPAQEIDPRIKNYIDEAFQATITTLVDKLPVVQGFTNPIAASIESKRLWWVSNWTEGNKVIEMLTGKLNLTTSLWKSIAVGAYVELQEFAYKNMKASAKFHYEELPLQTSEGGYQTIRKRPTYNKFSDISEWILAFRSYSEAVLIIYEDREQELNFYCDHINNLCIKYDFTAVMAYDEDHRLALVMDRNTTLFDRNIEAEGENFDASTIRRTKFNRSRALRNDATWHDGREICINWNRRNCNEDKKYGRVHACLTCKKIGHQEWWCFFNNTGAGSKGRQSEHTEGQN
ncbi:hypothetical protein C2G38_2049074 [Gigaspora rosea]|uniref:Uncharacterized protein n=1 Tax=Gigaspora rosea TaxID=44941 RepID=A0A397U989_9GLOM|nr:hypothetical protein C2G38_2049074 [Gigaspora rosea]